MNHVIHRSPDRKIFEKCFVISMLVATMVIVYTHCGNSANVETGEKIEQHDAEVQSDRLIAGVSKDICEVLETQTVSFGRPMRVFAASPNPMATNVLVQEEKVESEQEEHEDIKEEETETVVTETETVVNERPNTLYYINDNGWKSYLDEKYQNYLYDMCIKYDVEEYYTLFIAQMYHESGFDVDAVSATNDHGLMQINICNHDSLEKMFGFTDFLDPYVSIESGVYFMSEFLHKYNDVEKALVCYNRGESAVINGTYSTDYSKGVLADMNLLVELNQ